MSIPRPELGADGVAYLQALRRTRSSLEGDKEELLFWEAVFVGSLYPFYAAVSEHLWGILTENPSPEDAYDWSNLAEVDELVGAPPGVAGAYVRGAQDAMSLVLDLFEDALGLESQPIADVMERRSALEAGIRRRLAGAAWLSKDQLAPRGLGKPGGVRGGGELPGSALRPGAQAQGGQDPVDGGEDSGG